MNVHNTQFVDGHALIGQACICTFYCNLITDALWGSENEWTSTNVVITGSGLSPPAFGLIAYGFGTYACHTAHPGVITQATTLLDSR